MGLKKKLFPRKGKEKDDLVAQAKGHIHKLNMMNKNYTKRAEISRKNAKIALKRGEKDRAKSYLVQYKAYQAKVDRSNNIRLKIERQIQAIEEGMLDQKRFRNYLRLQKEIRHLKLRQDQKEARRINREWDKRIRRYHKEMKELRKKGLA